MTAGHDGGDAVLKVVAQRLRTTMQVDTVARLGGDEFVVLLDNPAHRGDIAHIAENCSTACARPSCTRVGKFRSDSALVSANTRRRAQCRLTHGQCRQSHVCHQMAGRNGFRFSINLRTFPNRLRFRVERDQRRTSWAQEPPRQPN